MEKIKLYSFYTDEVRDLKDSFLESLRDDWELHIEHLPAGGEWGTPGFNALMRKKVEYIVERIRDNPGGLILWSDIDIQFFAPCTGPLLRCLAGKDMVLLAEHWPQKEINSGFMAIRCNQRTLGLFTAIAATRFEELPFHEQSALNDALQSASCGVIWDVLPGQFWAMSHGDEPPADMLLHHANCTTARMRNGAMVGSLALKREQLKRVKNYFKLRQRFPLCCALALRAMNSARRLRAAMARKTEKT